MGLKWRTGDRSDIEDHRFDVPAVRAVADGVDGKPMTRCAYCKGGKLPERVMVTIMTIFTLPAGWLPVLSCPWCGNKLSRTSARKLSHQTVKVFKYE